MSVPAQLQRLLHYPISVRPPVLAKRISRRLTRHVSNRAASENTVDTHLGSNGVSLCCCAALMVVLSVQA